MDDLIRLGLWDADMKNELVASNGSVQVREAVCAQVGGFRAQGGTQGGTQGGFRAPTLGGLPTACPPPPMPLPCSCRTWTSPTV